MKNSTDTTAGTAVVRRFGFSWLVTILFSLFFALVMKPDILNTLWQFGLPTPPLQSGWDMTIIGISLCIVAAYFVFRHVDLFGVLVLVVVGAVLASTLYNKQALDYWPLYTLPCAAAALVVPVFYKKFAVEMLRGMLAASMMYLVLNLLYVLFWRSQVSLVFGDIASSELLFYGHRNNTYRIAIPAFACSLLLDAMAGRRGSVRTWLVFVLGAAEIIGSYSATSAVAFLLMGAIACLILYLPTSRKWANGLSLFLIYPVSFIGVVILRLQNFVGFFITGVLKRSITFSGRTAIWDGAIESLSGAAALTGKGTAYAIVVNDYPYYAHNDLLHLWLMGGLCAIGAYVALLAITCRCLYLQRKELLAGCFVAILLPFFVITLTESVLCPAFFFLLAMAYYKTRDAC